MDQNSSLLIEGRNAVLEALNAGRSIDKIFVGEYAKSEGAIKTIMKKASQRKIVLNFESKERLDAKSPTRKHQAVIAYVAAYDYVSVDDILQRAQERSEPPFILILDGIKDPHNLGAIIRTAEVVGVHGIIIPKRRACGLTETVVKTSAGAIEYLPIAKVTNCSQTIDYLKTKNIWVVGTDTDGQSMYSVDLKGALAIVIGEEGGGISELVKKNCDFIATIPMQGRIESLNASVATGVILYEAFRQRR